MLINRNFLLTAIVFLFCSAIAVPTYADNRLGDGTVKASFLMPVPLTVTFGSGGLRLDSRFGVLMKGHVDSRVKDGVNRAMSRLEMRTGLTFQHGQPEATAG